MRIFKLIMQGIFFLALISIQGCTDVAMSSAQVVYNRHSIQKKFNDQYITMQAFKAIDVHDGRFKNTHVVIATFNNEVLLAGQVPNPEQKVRAEELVRKIPDVKTIYNFITIADPTSTLTRMSDSWLTTKVKSKFLASDDLESNQIKVVTENGTVYLMGIVPAQEAEAAVDIARNTEGVSSVVKIFSYVHIDKNANRTNNANNVTTVNQVNNASNTNPVNPVDNANQAPA